MTSLLEDFTWNIDKMCQRSDIYISSWWLFYWGTWPPSILKRCRNDSSRSSPIRKPARSREHRPSFAGRPVWVCAYRVGLADAPVTENKSRQHISVYSTPSLSKSLKTLGIRANKRRISLSKCPFGKEGVHRWIRALGLRSAAPAAYSWRRWCFRQRPRG